MRTLQVFANYDFRKEPGTMSRRNKNWLAVCLIFILGLFLFLAPSVLLALNRCVTVVWDAPTCLAGPGGDCAVSGPPISESDLAALQYQVRWRIGTNGQYQVATTAQHQYTIENVPVGSTLQVSVGAFFLGGTVGCWTDPVSFVVPVPTVGPCSGVRISAQ